MARDRRGGDAHGDTGRGWVSLAGVQQPRLLAHHPQRHHDRRHRVRARSPDGPRRGARSAELMAYLEVRDLKKCYRTRSGPTAVLGGVDLTLEEGEFVAVVGDSRSGETPPLSPLAGLIPPHPGGILLHRGPVTRPGPPRRIA